MVFIVYPLVVFMSDRAWAIITNLIVYPLVVFIYFFINPPFVIPIQTTEVHLGSWLLHHPSSLLLSPLYLFLLFLFKSVCAKANFAIIMICGDSGVRCYILSSWVNAYLFFFAFVFVWSCCAGKDRVQLLGFLYYIIVWCCVFNRSKLYAQHLLIKQEGYIVLNRHTGSLPLSFPLGCWSILQKINSSFLKYIM